MRKWILSRRDSGDMVDRIESSLRVSLGLPRSAQASCAEPEEGVVFTGLDGFEFVEADSTLIPFLGSQKTLDLFPAAVVDEGAVKFLLNGADVMRPGVRKLDEWGEAGRLVVVKEERKGRAIAVGSSAVPSSEAQAMSKGICIKNLHYVGDRYWNLHRDL